MEQKYNKRIWELDVLRGFAFLLMVIDHLTYDLGNIFYNMWTNSDYYLMNLIAELSRSYRSSPLAIIIRLVFTSGVFLLVSGISANLSRNNFKRGFKLFIIAMLLTVGTIIIALLIDNIGIIIYFGILHCLAVSMMLTPMFKKINKTLLFLLGLIIIGFGTFLTIKEYTSIFIFVPFNITPENFKTADYYPLLPFMGIYIIGYIIGSIIYKNKISLFKKDINIFPLNYIGRNALWLYFVHQIVLFIVLYLIGFIFN